MAVSDDYQNAVEQLAAQTSTQVQDETDPVLIVAVINRARARAVTLADVYAARQVEDLLGDVVTPTGVLPADESERLTQAVDTVMTEGPENAGMRLERLARSEVFDAAQNGTTEALMAHEVKGRHLGWVRQLEAGHCERCGRWAQNGRVWPKNHRMPTHPNCNCVQRVVVTDTRPKPVKRKKRNG